MASYTSVTKYVDGLQLTMPATGSSWTVFADWTVLKSHKTNPVNGENGWNQCEIIWWGGMQAMDANTGPAQIHGLIVEISRETLTWADAYDDPFGYYDFHSECTPPESVDEVWCEVKIQDSKGNSSVQPKTNYRYYLSLLSKTSGTLHRYQWDDIHPPVPSSAPEVSINSDGTVATLFYDNIDPIVDKVKFKIIHVADGDFTDNRTYFDTVEVDNPTRTATTTVKLLQGRQYSFAGSYGTKYGTGANKYAWGDYSERSEWFKVKPVETTLIDSDIITVRENEVLIKWKSSVSSLDGIVAQYAQTIAELEAESGATFNEQEFAIETPVQTIKQTRLSDLETGVVWYFRIKGYVESNGAKYYTGWYYQKPSKYTTGKNYWAFRVPLGTIPDAPTTWTLQQNFAVEQTSDSGFNVYAIHNSEDGSPCSFFKIYAELYNRNGSLDRVLLNDVEVENKKDSYGEYVTDNLEYTIKPWLLYHDPFGYDQKEIRWRIKTKGAVDEYGPYSQTRVVKLYVQPTATASVTFSGSSTNMKYPLTVTANLSSSSQQALVYYFEIQSSSQYEYTDALGSTITVLPGTILYSSTFSATTTEARSKTVVLTATDINLRPMCSYVANITIYTNGGLIAQNSISFTFRRSSTQTMYPEIIEIDSDQDRSVYFKCRCYKDTRQQQHYSSSEVTMALYRYNSDGTYTLVDDNIPDNTWVRDPHPRLDHQIYRLTSTIIDTGDTTYVEPDYAYDMYAQKGVVIHWDEKWGRSTFGDASSPQYYAYTGQRVVLPFNVDVSETRTIDKTLIGYIGREDPVSYYGTSLGKEYSIKTEIPKRSVPGFDSDTVMLQLRKLSIFKGDAYVRTSTGIGCWATVDIDYNIDHCALTIPITIKVTPVEGGV